MKLTEKTKRLKKEIRGLQIYVFFASTAQVVVGLLLPFMMAKLIDAVGKTETEIYRLALMTVGLVFIDFILNWHQNYQWFKLKYRGEVSMRSMMFDGVSRNPYSFFLHNKNGDVTNRLLNDAAQYADNYVIKVLMLLTNITRLVGTLAFIFYYSIPIGVAICILCIVYFVSYKKINLKLRKYSKEERMEYSELLQTTSRFYDGIPTIQLYLKEEFFSKKYREKATELGEKTIRLQLWKSLAQSLSGLIIWLMPVAVIVIGVLLVMLGQCTVGAIFGIYAYVDYLGEPIQNLTDWNLGVQQAKVNGERLEELLVEQAKETEFTEQIEDITLQDICVSYEGNQKVLDDFSLKIKKGDRVGILGNSGCGKTTLSHVLTGELKPLSGHTIVNGKQIALSSCKKRIAVLPQNIFLYDDTIMDNIMFGREDRNRQEILDLLDVGRFANRAVSELSGGEKRRVGLARALFGDYDLLILDEPTAEIDEVMEEKTIQFLDKVLDEEKMLVVITHRPKILDICNKRVTLC